MFIFFTEISFFNILIGFLFVTILAIILALFVQSLISFSWVFLELGSVLIQKVYSDAIQKEASLYPFQFFKNSTLFTKIYFFIPIAYVSMLIVPIVSNLDFSYLLFSLKYLLIISVICSLIIYVNWRYGLKKYEAFG